MITVTFNGICSNCPFAELILKKGSESLVQTNEPYFIECRYKDICQRIERYYLFNED